MVFDQVLIRFSACPTVYCGSLFREASLLPSGLELAAETWIVADEIAAQVENLLSVCFVGSRRSRKCASVRDQAARRQHRRRRHGDAAVRRQRTRPARIDTGITLAEGQRSTRHRVSARCCGWLE
jgi:hypothetical protein